MKKSNKKTIISEDDQSTVNIKDVIFELLIACKFNLDEVNKTIDALIETSSSVLKNLAKDMKEDAIQKGMLYNEERFEV